MSSFALGLISFGALLGLLALRVPIAIALSAVSLTGITLLRGPDAALSALSTIPFDFVAHWSLSAIPMFVLMGTLAFRSGMTESLFKVARLWLNNLPGGLAIASTTACAGFAAASGSSIATASAMGRIAIPEMLRYKYDPGLATGTVAAAGTLGSMIPPSILIILYAVFAEVSIGQMLLAGILPGLLTAFIYSLMIVARCSINPELAPSVKETITWSQRITSLKEIWPLPVLVVAVLGGIYSGVFTATEASAGGAFSALIIAAIQGRLSREVLLSSSRDAVKITAAIFLIAIGAILLTRFMAITGFPRDLAAFIFEIDPSVTAVILFSALLFIILGMFLDSIGVMLLLLPILLPAMEALDVNLFWFGILVIKFLEIGLITPPVGLNVYVIKSVVGNQVPLETIFRGIGWFVVAEMVALVFLISFPIISLLVPGLMAR